ncbi:MAG: hypothetical protein UT26_C0053G0004 [Microgenomates group bacterium GW2011_GWC1_39_12]|nr:MAG: hypothetical protein UT26_C0053G0004 [Microgenomates group bacterium GW2011_GWC1_39_12]
MNKKLLPIIIGVCGIGVLILGLTLLKKSPSKPQEPVIEEEQLVAADSSIVASVTWSKIKDNTIVLSVSGLKNGYTKVAYEVSYETQGVVQGVTTRPLDITGKDTFVRDDIYLGTCSKNVCKPHTGVKKVSLVLEFTDTSGKKSQLAKDFDL